MSPPVNPPELVEGYYRVRLSQYEGSPPYVYGGTLCWLLPEDGHVSFHIAGMGEEAYVWDGDNIVLTDEFDKDFIFDMLQTVYPEIGEVTYEGVRDVFLPVDITAIIDGNI